MLAKIRALNRVLCVEEARHASAEVIGAAGARVLQSIYEATAPAFPARDARRADPGACVWVQNYTWIEGTIRWRSCEEIPPAAQSIGSPYDTAAHSSKKRSTTWVGSQVHLTETGEKGSPHLITQVDTTSAPVSDAARTARIHEELKQKDLLPQQHIVDTGYVDARLLVESQQTYHLDLVGPTRRTYPWQASQQKGFDADHFLSDWERQQATWTAGTHQQELDPGHRQPHQRASLQSNSRGIDCQACPSLRLCTQSLRHVRRTVTIRPKEQDEALQARRQLETTKDFKALSATRAGVEGTISQGVRTMGLRRSRSIGQERTHLQHVATAAAINVVRLMRWLNGESHAKTRPSPLVQVLRPAA